jgi:predicted Zn-dependent protease
MENNSHANFKFFVLNGIENFEADYEVKFLTDHEFINCFNTVKKGNIFKEKIEPIDKYYKNIQNKKTKDKRYSLTPKIFILPLFITKSKNQLQKYNSTISKIKQLSEAYFNLKVKVENLSKVKLIARNKKYYIQNFAEGVEFELSYDTGMKNFDALELLNILLEYVENRFCFVILTDVNLYEGEPENEVFGRAYGGNGIAIVSLKGVQEREAIITFLHETMHTFNIGHCSAWDCIMNAKNDEEYSCIHLCPLDLLRMKIFNPTINYNNRFIKLKNLFEKFKWERDSNFIETLLKLT